MRDDHTQQSTDMDTERMTASTMNQSRQAMEQLIDLQRNVARMTLSAIEWQETAQRQGLEMAKTILESAPGPQFTESMMQSYLQGMDAIVPEMEQVMERGMQAATQPQMEGMGSQMQGMGGQPTAEGQFQGGMEGQRMHRHQSGGARNQQPERMQRQQPEQMQRQQTGNQQPAGQGTGGSMGDQQRPSQHRTSEFQSGGQQTGSQRPDPRRETQSGMRTGRQGSSGRFQPQGSQHHAQTGEWITPREYGGESSGTTDYQQQPMTAAPTHSPESQQFEQGRQQEQWRREGQPRDAHPRPGSQREHGQRGGPPQGGERGGREYDQSTQRGQLGPGPGQTEQGRLRDQYSRRIDTDHREGGERSRSTGGGQRRGESDRPPERRAMEETDVTSEQPAETDITSEQPADPTEDSRGEESDSE